MRLATSRLAPTNRTSGTLSPSSNDGADSEPAHIARIKEQYARRFPPRNKVSMPRAPKSAETMRAEICERIADGESMDRICKSDNMPKISTVRRWLEDIPAFAAAVARARAQQAEHFVDTLPDLVDRTDAEPNRLRLMADTRKWLASKAIPLKYGDKLQLDAKVEVNLAMLVMEAISPIALAADKTENLDRTAVDAELVDDDNASA